MFFGRLMGWVFLGLAVIMASADAVMALGPADYAGIATAEMLTLLTGGEPVPASTSVLSRIENMVLELPAWMAFAALGAGLLLACRKPSRRYRFRHASAFE